MVTTQFCTLLCILPLNHCMCHVNHCSSNCYGSDIYSMGYTKNQNKANIIVKLWSEVNSNPRCHPISSKKMGTYPILSKSQNIFLVSLTVLLSPRGSYYQWLGLLALRSIDIKCGLEYLDKMGLDKMSINPLGLRTESTWKSKKWCRISTAL